MYNKNNNNIYIAHIALVMCQSHYKCSTHTDSLIITLTPLFDFGPCDF